MSSAYGTEMTAVPCTIMRGGTSKAVFLPESAVPAGEAERAQFLLALMGSPDPRQIDGLGGADLLTSKVAIVGAPSVPGADIDYTFAQVGTHTAQVHFDMLCGNISAAVGVYAIEKGLVAAVEPWTQVRIYNHNTRTVLLSDVPVVAGHAAVEGDLAIDGVPGTGARVRMDYRLTAGSTTGRLLPTGNVQDRLQVDGLGTVTVSIVDIANLCFMVRAEELGLDPARLPSAPDEEALRRTDLLQRAVARHVGVPEGRLTPIPILVAAPHQYPLVVGTGEVSADAMDIAAQVNGGQPLTLHKAFPGAASVTLAVGARIPGTVAYEVARPAQDALLRIGHPSGRMEVEVEVRVAGREIEIVRAGYLRTARLLLDGTTYLRAARLTPGVGARVS